MRVETGSYNFWRDVERSNKEEREVVRALEKICGLSLLDITFGEKKKEYDLLLETIFGTVKIEVKTDYSHAKYGNIAVEFWCRGKPSGVDATEADYWIYKVYERDGSSGLYLIKTENLKTLIENKKWHRQVSGGDRGSDTQLYLFKGDIFKAECREL